MKAVLQRVTKASVTINGKETRSIGPGLVILLGVMPGDTEKHSATMANKLCQMRIFSDENGKMNRSLLDVGGSMLVVYIGRRLPQGHTAVFFGSGSSGCSGTVVPALCA